MRIVIAVALIVAAAASASAETLKVTVGQKGFWNADFVEFARIAGFLKEADLDVEVIYTEGGAATLEPVISGNVDIGMTNGTLGVIAAYVRERRSASSPPRRPAPTISSGMRRRRAASTVSRMRRTGASAFPRRLVEQSRILALLTQQHVSARLVATGGAPSTMTQVMTGQIDVGWTVPPWRCRTLTPARW